jgi:outer membrane protein assembly factor BamB
VGSTQAKGSGRIEASFTVPTEALPGDHRVTAAGELSGLLGSAQFVVRTDWPQNRFDLANSAYNGLENVLSPSNVADLRTKWWVGTGYYAAPEPVIVDGVVYAVTYYGDVNGYDVDDGHLVWTASTGSVMSGDSPAVSDGVLYTGTMSGDVVAFSLATGAEVWRTDVGSGVTDSPRVADGVVYVGTGYFGSLFAIDGATGAVLWSNPGVGVRQPVAVANGLVYAAPDYGPLFAIDPATGVVVWSAPFPSDTFAGSPPVVADGYVAIGNHTDNKVTVWDALTGRQLWSRDTGGEASPPIIVNGVLYVDAGYPKYDVRAYDVAIGVIIWSSNLAADVYELIAANGVLYMGSYGGQMYAVDMSTGQVLWTSVGLGSYAWGDPAIADGILYGSAYNGRIYAFGLP